MSPRTWRAALPVERSKTDARTRGFIRCGPGETGAYRPKRRAQRTNADRCVAACLIRFRRRDGALLAVLRRYAGGHPVFPGALRHDLLSHGFPELPLQPQFPQAPTTLRRPPTGNRVAPERDKDAVSASARSAFQRRSTSACIAAIMAGGICLKRPWSRR